MDKTNTISYKVIDGSRVLLDTAEFIEISEARYKNQIKSIVSETINNKHRIIRLAGPSGSGKTTSALKIVEEILNRGIPAYYLSMDNWYKTMPVNELPLTDDGDPDYESPELLDIDGFKQDMHDLILGKTINLREFDFINRVSNKSDNTLEIQSNAILVIEGLHAINPIFDVDESNIKVYVEPSNIKLNDNTILTSKELRLFRRIHRDKVDRGMSLEATIQKCKSVDKGQDKYIAPYIRNPEIFKVDTLIYYEIYIHKHELDGLIDSEALRTITGANISSKYIPEDSVLREFYKQ